MCTGEAPAEKLVTSWNQPAGRYSICPAPTSTSTAAALPCGSGRPQTGSRRPGGEHTRRRGGPQTSEAAAWRRRALSAAARQPAPAAAAPHREAREASLELGIRQRQVHSAEALRVSGRCSICVGGWAASGHGHSLTCRRSHRASHAAVQRLDSCPAGSGVQRAAKQAPCLTCGAGGQQLRLILQGVKVVRPVLSIAQGRLKHGVQPALGGPQLLGGALRRRHGQRQRAERALKRKIEEAKGGARQACGGCPAK